MPPFLLGTATLVWGWQTGFWAVAVPIAVLLELPRVWSRRWDLDISDFKQVTNVSFLMVLAFTIYFLTTSQSRFWIYAILPWLPVFTAPLVVAQIYSQQDQVPLSALLMVLRRAETLQGKLVDLRLAFFAICLLAASAGNLATHSFYLCLVILVGWWLWSTRSQRCSAALWLCLLLLAGSIGFIGQAGLHQLHVKLERQFLSFFGSFDADPTEKSTSIGDLGRLKLSNQIRFRVRPIQISTDSLQTSTSGDSWLLQEAVYNKYQASLWVAADSEFEAISARPQSSTWLLEADQPIGAGLSISLTLPAEPALLKVPEDTVQIQHLPAIELRKNQYGTIRVEGKPSLVTYETLLNPAAALGIPPNSTDLELPPAEATVIENLAQQLGLQGQELVVALKTLHHFFQREFAYTLDLERSGTQATPLANFLLEDRRGHCEYFATATTLLLRAAGIPARYVIGYSVHEFSSLEQQYVVRERHAHAWSLAYVNKQWVQVDTTPEIWVTSDTDQLSRWSALGDLWAWLQFRIGSGIHGLRQLGILQNRWWWLLLLIIVAVRLLWPQQRRQRSKVSPTGQAQREISSIPVQPSILRLVKVLEQAGFERHNAEAMRPWLRQLQSQLPQPLRGELQIIIELHYRDRFDPQGIDRAEQEHLQLMISQWLPRFQAWQSQATQPLVPRAMPGSQSPVNS